jgi:anti-sigma B factor antagonist
MPDPSQRGRIPFAISHRELDTRTSVVSIEGDCDLATAPSLKWGLVDLVAAGRSRLILDLSLVTFMDSTALGALIGVQRRLDASGMMVIAAAPLSVLRLLELTGLDRKLSLCSTVDAALTHVLQTPSASAENSDPAGAAGDDTSRVEHQRAPPTTGDAPDVPGDDAASDETQLTRDAALALGIAATAVPFARSGQAQAERWLRALQSCGGAGIALSSLGVTDIPQSQLPEHEAVDRPDSQGADDRDAVATVTQCARRIASHRGSSPIRTTDLLSAVIEVYGSDLDRLLVGHGTNSGEVIKLLDRGLPGPRER